MPSRSQPLDEKIAKKLSLDYDDMDFSDRKIISQRMGEMFDDFDFEERKISLKTCIGWKWNSVKDFYYTLKHTIRNHIKWHKTMKKLRPWSGYNALIEVMNTQLKHYIEYEEKHGHSEESYKNNKISTVQETLELLERMKDPMDYSSNRRNAVEVNYPKYLSIISKYENGGTSVSGDFVVQGDGWVGIKSGKDPREGYFELINGRFELTKSPNQEETDRLLAQIHEYHKEIHSAYAQAETDSEEDFAKLAKLLKENFYTWWD